MKNNYNKSTSTNDVYRDGRYNDNELMNLVLGNIYARWSTWESEDAGGPWNLKNFNHTDIFLIDTIRERMYDK